VEDVQPPTPFVDLSSTASATAACAECVPAERYAVAAWSDAAQIAMAIATGNFCASLALAKFAPLRSNAASGFSAQSGKPQ
jgi:hypothetical protein